MKSFWQRASAWAPTCSTKSWKFEGTPMTTFILTVIGIWLVALVAWLLVSRSVRNSDMDRIKGRLIGKQQKKSKSSNPEEAALFTAEEPAKGKIVLGIL